MAPVRRLRLRSRIVTFYEPSLHTMVLRSGRGYRRRRGRIFNRDPLVVPLNAIPDDQVITPLAQEAAPAADTCAPLVPVLDIPTEAASAVSSVDPLVVNVTRDADLSAGSPAIDFSNVDFDTIDISYDFSSYDPSVFNFGHDTTGTSVTDSEAAVVNVASDSLGINPSLVDVDFDIADIDSTGIERAEVDRYLPPDDSGVPEVASVLPPADPLPIPPIQNVLDFVAQIGFQGPVFVVDQVLSFEEAVAILFDLLHSQE